MNFTELRNHLKDQIRPAYVISGSDIFLVNKAIEMISATSTDVSKISDNIVESAMTPSFFGGRRIIIARDPEITTQLKNYLKNPNPDTTLVLVTENLVKNAEHIDCNPMDSVTLEKLIVNNIAKHGKKINRDAVGLIIEFCESNYSQIDSELNKIVNYFTNITITADDVKQVINKPFSYKIYELSNAICRGDLTEAEKMLQSFDGQDEYMIFASLVGSFRRLWYSLQTFINEEQVATVLGCKPFAVKIARRDNKHLEKRITDTYKYALDLEYQIKSGKVGINNAIVLLSMATNMVQ